MNLDRQVEDKLFRFDRTLLDQEMDTITRGAGSKEDPIELEHIKAADFEILLDFLKLGTRHDKEPLKVSDWTSIIAVCCILGMHRVQNLACETLSDHQQAQKALLDQQKILLDQQKTLLDQQKILLDQQNASLSSAGASDLQNSRLDISRAGAGFDTATYGLYFFIQEKGTAHCLLNSCCSPVEGIFSSSIIMGYYAMPPVALQSISSMMCLFCVDVDPLIGAQTHGHIPCRNFLSSTRKFK
ncbi:hypothetical protein FIBSPDRAFT_865074 [Athelia psychrophila]|uniref:BTB domain-containing protein n=1 Tax=Athelia psychrophila TaxID=1759441 RepID=A0A166G2I3_9AGAM|nr:hypothetical protein FIBSPDRAFT_865074 [Fibularhizoctonia sp. CBS 109695]